MKAAVITISDSASRGIYEDISGPDIERIFNKIVPSCNVDRIIVPDEVDDILKAFKSFEGYDFILISGGTGIGPRDVTPDITEKYCDRELHGMTGTTIIVNFPGSVKAVRLYTKAQK